MDLYHRTTPLWNKYCSFYRYWYTEKKVSLRFKKVKQFFLTLMFRIIFQKSNKLKKGLTFTFQFLIDLWAHSSFSFVCMNFRLYISCFLSVNLELMKNLWIPNIFIYNLKSFRTIDVLSKLAGLWIDAKKRIYYSQATHITFICEQSVSRYSQGLMLLFRSNGLWRISLGHSDLQVPGD